ncbi:MAG: hypothetical protein ABI224_01385 [Acetobacteraceae bacterium]
MKLVVPAVLVGLLLLSAGGAWAQAPRHHCARVGTDDALRPLPPSFVGQVVRLFGLERMPIAQVERSTVIRCMEGRLLACNYGANLPCGKANTSASLPAAADWCRQKPDADFIPAYISGHDSAYRWRCTDGAPVAGGPVARTDARGFLARYWKPLD